MNGPGRRFDPNELTGVSGAPLSDFERLAAATTAREIEASIRDAGSSDGFTERVMAAIATEPAPQPVIAFGSAVRARRIGATIAAVRDAWRVALGAGRPIVLRGQALALGLVVLLAVGGVAGGAAIGAVRLLVPDATPTPTIEPTPVPSVEPSPSIEPSPSPSPSPTNSPEPTDTPEPSETPEATDDDDGGEGAARPTDDSSGSGSGSSGSGSSGSGDDGDDDDGTPEPDDDSSGSGSGDDDPDGTDEPDETDEPDDD
jgi:hypothetical protein